MDYEEGSLHLKHSSNISFCSKHSEGVYRCQKTIGKICYECLDDYCKDVTNKMKNNRHYS